VLKSLLGKLSFASQVLPGARLFLRCIIDTIRSRPHGRIQLAADFRADVQYWLDHMLAWNGAQRGAFQYAPLSCSAQTPPRQGSIMASSPARQPPKP
jgi:hypothetical protein